LKSSRQILDLPVLSIEEGKEIGRVKHLVLNPQRGAVDYILVEDQAWYQGLKAMPYAAVQGIGAYALTVANRSSLSEVTECTGIIDLLEKDLRLPGLKVLSTKGCLLGSVSEFYIHDQSGDIAGCQLIPENSQKAAGIIPGKFILTYGSDYLVVEEGIEEKLVKELTEDHSAATGSRNNRVETTPAGTGAQDAGQKKSPGAELKHFEEQQRQFILGKKAALKITDDDGKVVVEEGETITQEIIDRAKAADKYIQLTLNISD
jgi:uncharacterized protein YrrD